MEGELIIWAAREPRSPRVGLVQLSVRVVACAFSVATLGCDRAPQVKPHQNQSVQSAEAASREDSLARIRWRESARYRQLMLAVRTAFDKRSAYEQTTCETQRLWDKLGQTEGTRAILESDFVLMRTKADSIAQRKIDSALHMQGITLLNPEQCDSIGRSWPPLDTVESGYPGAIILPPRY